MYIIIEYGYIIKTITCFLYEREGVNLNLMSKMLTGESGKGFMGVLCTVLMFAAFLFEIISKQKVIQKISLTPTELTFIKTTKRLGENN